jgi:CubicO group peptidase (beta-lactamase class C family)
MHKIKFDFILLAFILNLVIVSSVSSQSTGTANEQQTELAKTAIKLFPVNTQFAIAIVDGGTTTFLGVKREKDNVVTISNQKNVFEIGSISKVFTSTLLAESVLAGKITLDKNIGETLDFPLKDNVKITFQQLANHTSGLPRLATNQNIFGADPANPYKDYDEAKLIEYLKNEIKLAQEPGTKYEYSNLAVGLLGYLVGRIEDKAYEELLQEKIFKRYKMTSSTTLREKVSKTALVKGLNAGGDEVSNWDLAVLAGAGGILSSSEDLSKFAMAQFDDSNKAMTLTRKKTFDINERMSIGLAWHIIKKDGVELFNHNGGTGGYRSNMSIDIQGKRAVIVLSNVTAFHPDSGKIDALSFDLLKTIAD